MSAGKSGGPFACCPHCVEDPTYHENGVTGHDGPCPTCEREEFGASYGDDIAATARKNSAQRLDEFAGKHAAKTVDHEGNLVGYYFTADQFREMRALVRGAL